MDSFIGDGIHRLAAGNGGVGVGGFGDGDPGAQAAGWSWRRPEFEDNTKILKEIHDRSMNICNSFCSDPSFDGNEETEQESDSEFRAQDSSPDGSPSFHRELLNKSVGSMQNIIARTARDHIRDLNSSGDRQSDDPVACGGVSLNPQTCVRQYDVSSSEDEERMERYKENRAAMIHNDTHKSAMARIEDMWDMFAVDDYAPWSEFRESAKLKRSQSMSKIDANTTKSPNAASVWKKKTTVPQPPMMLLREANKTPKKTKAMIELDQYIEEKKRLEDLECKKQFKATPAPDHIHLRLFEEMNRQQEEKQMFLRENIEKIHKSLQKPFEFVQREELKKQEKLREFKKFGQKKPNGHFHARPFPSHIFSGTVEDRILEEEEYRQIRMRMRAEELLNSSVAPYSMRMQNWRKVGSKHRKSADDETESYSFHPKVNQTVPDLDEQYQRFMEQMIQCKGKKKLTTCQPFNLRLSKPRRHSFRHNATHHSPKANGYERKVTTDSLMASLDLSSARPNVDKESSKPDASKRQKLAGKKVLEKQTPKKMMIETPGNMNALDDLGEVATKSRHVKSEAGISMPMKRQIDKFDAENEMADENVHNRTYDLDKQVPRCGSETSESNVWCHPSIVKRSQFWSNPVENMQL